MKMNKEQSQQHPSGKNHNNTEKLNNNGRSSNEMKNKMVSTMQNKMGAFAAVACLALGFASVAQAQVVSLQDGVNAYAGTADTFLAGDNRFGAANVANGSINPLSVFEREVGLDNYARILIRFDLSSLTDPSVTNASLRLTYSGWAGAGSTGVGNSLYLINAADTAWSEAQSTYNNLNQSTTTPWAGGPGLASGTDYNATPIATAITPNSGATSVGQFAGSTMTFTFNAAGVAAINNWIANPANNTGFFIRQPTGSFSIDQFYSSESSIAADHPLLTLEIPEPSAVMLIGAGGLLVFRRRFAS